jgi:alpha-galactosidase
MQFSIVHNFRTRFGLFFLLMTAFCGSLPAATKLPSASLAGKDLSITAEKDGSYSIRAAGQPKPVLRAVVAAQIDHHWLRSSDYPRHTAAESSFQDESGDGKQLTILHTGLAGQPDLAAVFRQHTQAGFLELSVEVRNSSGKALTVQTVRLLETAAGKPVVNLGGAESAARVLSDSFSEDRPAMVIHDLGDEPGMHRAVASQLIYNRESKNSLFLAALTSQRWLTILRLRTEKTKSPKSKDKETIRIAGYEVDSTGTTEMVKENSLREAPAEDQIELSLPVAAGANLSSERLLISFGADYHAQLESYGDIIRRIHHARVSAPTPVGWWSWTAYYFGLSQDTAATNVQWQAEHLKKLGYTFFHLDEGYQYARGEYTTADATLFPGGLKAVGDNIRNHGLTMGIWTAPFEVSERAWVFENHKDWLVHNAAGKPIHAGYVTGKKDKLFVLDTTNPAAQDYLRKTYTTLARDWGIRYIKMDFMEDTAIEGYYFKPNTTALEAQRLGLQIIRESVGEDVLLDKDGSAMLNPVGIVDTGRISVDTGHTFAATREAGPGVAARYYMNRNFFVSDPDAFSVSRQTLEEQEWHGGKRPLTLDEAKASIALSAVSGGMYEIGDDMPTLGMDPERIALVENRDLINMVLLGKASRPLDLMNYTPEDGMPSVFLLQESPRQTILTVFNWTDKPRTHRFAFSDLGLSATGQYQLFDVFEAAKAAGTNQEAIQVDQPAHSARIFKIVDTSVAPATPSVQETVPSKVETGKPAVYFARVKENGVPALSYRWDFGDGTSADGAAVTHTYTRQGSYKVHLAAEGVDGGSFEKSVSVEASGTIDTVFTPAKKKRLTEKQ